MKKGRRNDGDMYWWNEEEKEATQQKKVTYKRMCENRSGETRLNIEYEKFSEESGC